MQKESLAEFVRITRRDKGLSLMAVRINSGKRLATSYISRIENGEVKNVSPEKLTALAKGLAVSEEVLFSLVRGKVANQETVSQEKFLSIAKVYSDLPTPIKNTLDPFIDAFEATLLGLQNHFAVIDESKPDKRTAREKLARFIVDPDDEDEEYEDQIKKPSQRKAS